MNTQNKTALSIILTGIAAIVISVLMSSCGKRDYTVWRTIDNGDGTFDVYEVANPYTDSVRVVGNAGTYSYNQ